MPRENNTTKERCLTLFAELSTTADRLYARDLTPDEEVRASLALEDLDSQVFQAFGLERDNLEKSLELREEIFAEAVCHPVDAVRNGLEIHLNATLGLGLRQSHPKPGQHELVFGVMCRGFFPGADFLGAMDDVNQLALWVSQRVMLPVSQLRVHPQPSLPSLCFADYSELLYEVCRAKFVDAQSLEDAAWTSLPANEPDFSSEIVIFWVTATVESQSQFTRVEELVAEGAPGAPKHTMLTLPFTLDGVQKSAAIAPYDFDWPMSALVGSVFTPVVMDIVAAVDRLSKREMPPERLLAEIRVSAAEGQEFPVTFFVELQDKDTGIVMATVPGLNVEWFSAFMPKLCLVVEQLGLANGSYRNAPRAALQYFFE